MTGRSIFLLVSVAALASAAEGIPGWTEVLDGVLRRAEAHSAGEAAEPDPPRKSTALTPPAVDQFAAYFRGPGAGTWSASLRRLEPIRSTVERIFDEEGVPRELLWLGLVESGYNPAARSPKDALGVWQLMPATARRFGLEVGTLDERTDVVKSTRAAAKYLRFLYATFADWHLAFAAYNAGEGRVESAIARAGTRDFWKLAGSGHLPRETAAYVPAVLAAQHIGTGATVAQAGSERSRAKVLHAPFTLSP